jgi:hypothetical protein
VRASAALHATFGFTPWKEHSMSERHHDRPETPNEKIDEAIDESFPASDPPSWSKGQEMDPPVIDPEKFERERRAEEYAKYGSGERHDGR